MEVRTQALVSWSIWQCLSLFKVRNNGCVRLFWLTIDPIYQMCPSTAAPKKSQIQPRIQSLPFHIAAHISAYLALDLLRLKSWVTYLDGNLFNLQFRGRGDIPDSSDEEGKKKFSERI